MSETTKKEYRSSLREDYDHSLKMKGDSLLCYSPKKAKGGLEGQVVGEVLLKVPRPPKPPREGKEPKPEPPSVGQFRMGTHNLPARSVGTHTGVFYKEAGYVWVGEGSYLRLLTDRRPFLFTLLALILSAAAAIAVTIVVVLSLLSPAVLAPDYQMPERDESSLPIEGEEGGEGGTGGGKVESEIGGGFVSMHYTKTAKVDLSDATIQMFFANPYKSNHSVVLELYVTHTDRDWLVAKSGRVDAGYGIKTMTFNEQVRLTPTTEKKKYEGKYILRFYDPDSGERAVFATEITGVIFTVVE